MKLNAKELRVTRPTDEELKKIKRRQVYIICDNILDAFNVGSIFRLADAVGVSKVYLCGQMQTPPYHRIAKAAVGTDKWVAWEHKKTALKAIEDLVSSVTHPGGEESLMVIAIEQGKNSVDFRKVDFHEPVAFVVGHETTGVSRDAIKACDQLVEIPMYGVNRSLNVVISLAMTLSKIL